MELLKAEKKLVIFDVGLLSEDFFTNNILKLIGKKKFKFFLFDINKNTKEYISKFIIIKKYKLQRDCIE